MLFMRINLKQNSTERLQVRSQENIDQAYTNQIKCDRGISLSDDINFKTQSIFKDKEAHYLMITKTMFAFSKSLKMLKAKFFNKHEKNSIICFWRL